MAGLGKGILRIAIEDFLETFDPSNLFENAIGNFGKFMFDNVFGRYIDIFETMADVSKIPAFQALAATHSTKMNFFEKVFILTGILTAVVTTFGQAYSAPFGKLLGYYLEKNVETSRFPIDAFLRLYRMYPNEAAKWIDDYKEQGFNSERIQSMLTAQNNELDVSLLVALYWRGLIDQSSFTERCYKLGIDSNRAGDILKAYEVIPNVSDLIRMSVREAFSPDVIARFRYDEAFPDEVLQYTRKQGLPDDWVKRFWYAHWELPSPSMGYEMLHRLRKGRQAVEFTESDLDLLLRTADYAPYFRERMKAISYDPITRVDIRRIYKLGIFDAEEVKQRYMDIGYNEKDAQTLADFTVKYEDASGNDVRETYKQLSFSVLRSLYDKGKISDNELRARLSASKYADTEINLIIEYFKLVASDSASVDYKAQFISEMVKYVSDAYQVEMISEGEAKSTLSAIGLNDANIDYILQKADYVSKLDILNETLKKIHDSYIAGALTRNEMIAELGKLGISGSQQNNVIAQMELDLKYPNRRLTEAQYRTAVTRGLITIDDYKANMIGLGYTQYDIDLLVALNFPT